MIPFSFLIHCRLITRMFFGSRGKSTVPSRFKHAIESIMFISEISRDITKDDPSYRRC